VTFTSERSIRRIILALFFLSGACGLVYEVVWMRMLTLVFGATAFATAAILSSFFAGLVPHAGRQRDRRVPAAGQQVGGAGLTVWAFSGVLGGTGGDRPPPVDNRLVPAQLLIPLGHLPLGR
jgi:predicted membrane-bound spermidine synthase